MSTAENGVGGHEWHGCVRESSSRRSAGGGFSPSRASDQRMWTSDDDSDDWNGVRRLSFGSERPRAAESRIRRSVEREAATTTKDVEDVGSRGGGDGGEVDEEEAGAEAEGAPSDGIGTRLCVDADDALEEASRKINRDELAHDGGQVHLSVGSAQAAEHTTRSCSVAFPEATQAVQSEHDGMDVRVILRGVSSLRATTSSIGTSDYGHLASDSTCFRASDPSGSNDAWRNRGRSRPVCRHGDVIYQLPLRADRRARRSSPAEGLPEEGVGIQRGRDDSNTTASYDRRARDEPERVPAISRLVSQARTGLEGTSCGGTVVEHPGPARHRNADKETRPVRGAVHRGGEEGMGAGSVGGVPSQLGGLADIGGCWRPIADVGADEAGEEDGSIREMAGGAGGAALVATPTLATAAVSRRRERCQRKECMGLRAELRTAQSNLKVVQLSLEKERGLRETLVQGEVRALRISYDKERLDREEAERRKGAAERKGRHFRSLAEAAESTISQLSEELATARATIAQLKSEEQQRLRREAIDARALEREARKESRDHRLEIQSLLEKAMRLEVLADEAARQATESREQAAAARTEAIAEAEARRVAAEKAHSAEYEALLAGRQAERARRKSEQLQERLYALCPLSSARTAEEWAQLSGAAKRKARQRECDYLRGLFESHPFRPEDIATVLSDLGILEAVAMESREGFEIYFQRVEHLMRKLETEEYGLQFALFLHYEMRLPLTKIHRLVQAASKMYVQKHDIYCAKALLCHPFRSDRMIKVPRLAPPRATIYTAIQDVQAKLGVQASDDGSLAFRSFGALLHDLVLSDAGKQSVPSLAEFLSGVVLHFCIQFDATGYGMQQLNTIAIRNPRLSASAQQLRIFGLGNCSDDRDGSTSLLGPNLSYINELIDNPRIAVEGGQVTVEPLFCSDLAALRHTEHVAASGWCGCSRDVALRRTPKEKPSNAAELATFLKQCRCPSPSERFILSHSPLPGEDIPRPCSAPGCTFAHNRSTAQRELDELLQTEKELASNTTKAGKAAFSRWRMAHAQTHSNIQPGKYGRPMFRHHLDNQILDSLHLRDLGIPKIPWKYGILNNASDDARAEIAALLNKWGHPLDTRRKDDNRSRNQKWFTGEAWNTFCNGSRGSPGGPVAIAQLVLIIANDLLLRGVEFGSGCATAEHADAPAAQQEDAGAEVLGAHALGGGGRGRGRGGRQSRSKSAFSDRAAAKQARVSDSAGDTAGEDEAATNQGVHHQPTQVEKDADADAVRLIRETFQSRSQTILNALLAFDAYFTWYYPMKDGVSFMCPIEEREKLALHCCRTAIDMHEIFERISARNHGSYLPHGAIFKMPRDILKIGDNEAAGASPLELQNAETKRAASSVGARNVSFLERHKGRPNATSMALSTLNHVLAAQYLRRREGALALDASRATERLFGVESKGRLTLKWVKPDVDGQYRPRMDTCVRAFARLLVEQQAHSAGASTS